MAGLKTHKSRRRRRARRLCAVVPAGRMIEFQKIWIDQCEAALDIKDAFGLEKAIGYLIGEKFLLTTA